LKINETVKSSNYTFYVIPATCAAKPWRRRKADHGVTLVTRSEA